MRLLPTLALLCSIGCHGELNEKQKLESGFCGLKELRSGKGPGQSDRPCEGYGLNFEELESDEIDTLVTKLQGDLKFLNMRANKLYEDDAVKLMGAVAESKSLKGIVFRENTLPTAAALLLVRALHDVPTLTGAKFTNVPLGKDAAVVAKLGEAIAHNLHLRNLDLSVCDLGPAGAVALAEGLANNYVLEGLDLRHNPFGDEGALVLAKAIEDIHDGSNLAEIMIDHPSIETEGRAALKRAAENMPGVEVWKRWHQKRDEYKVSWLDDGKFDDTPKRRRVEYKMPTDDDSGGIEVAPKEEL